MKGLAVFLREAIKNPSTVGALFPSSKKLANAVAQQIPNNTDLVIELGAGTGAITSSLLENKKPEEQLIVIERSAKLAKHLAIRFPGLNLIQGDADHLNQLLSNQISTPERATIVSSLPLRSLPSETIKKIGQEIDQVLKKGSIFIQYTYSLWGKPLTPSPNLKLIHKQWIWQNLPPARIDVFYRQ